MSEWTPNLRIQELSFLHRHDEAVHDVVLAFRRVLAHVKIEDRPGLGARGVFDFAQAHLLADELRELFRADFAQRRTGVAPVSNFKQRHKAEIYDFLPSFFTAATSHKNTLQSKALPRLHQTQPQAVCLSIRSL